MTHSLDRCCVKSTSSVCPLSLVSAVKQAMPFFRGYRQQDAQEFLRFFLDRLECEETLTVQTRSVSSLFKGSFRSEVTCLQCRTKTHKLDPFLDLSLDIPIFRIPIQHDGKHSQYRIRKLNILDCLKSFTDLEYLKATELYHCESCQSRQKCTKKIQLEDLPTLLVLHLKRFRSGAHLARRHRLKLRTIVEFPLENMNVASCCSPTYQGSTACDLRGIVCHHGSSVGCGHYSTYSIEESTQQWLHFNDASVTPVASSVVKKCEPYILVYAKR